MDLLLLLHLLVIGIYAETCIELLTEPTSPEPVAVSQEIEK